MKGIKKICLIILCVFTMSSLNALTVDIVNMIPVTLSDETNQDSQPDLTVSPDEPQNIVAGVLTPNPGGPGNAPIFYSIDGGMTWRLNTIVPSGFGKTKGITVAFGSDQILYAAIINDLVPDAQLMQILRTDDFMSPVLMTVLREREQCEQPYIRAGFPMVGPLAGNNTIYVGYNWLDAPIFPRTAYIEYSTDAAFAPPPAGLNPASIEFRVPAPKDGPAIRPAIHPDGTIYAVYMKWFNFTGTALDGMASGDLIVVRDDDWGAGAPPAFDDLIEFSDLLPGRIVVPEVNVRWKEDGLGQEWLKDRLAIAVDPTSGLAGTNYRQIVYVAYTDYSMSDSTIRVCRSEDSGDTWTLNLNVIPNAINPQLAVNSLGVVALLYQRLNEDLNAWETILEYSFNLGDTWQPPVILSRTPANFPVRVEYPYLGDYAALTTVGEWFYGAFSANNTPDLANFPDADNVTYQRHHDFLSNTLFDDGGEEVDISIDPFFFKVHLTEYHIRGWTVDATNHDLGEEPSTQWVVWQTSDVWNQTSDVPPIFFSDIPQNQNPIGGATNYAFARVHRNNADTEETVLLHFMVSEFGCGSSYVSKGFTTLTFLAGEFSKILPSGHAWPLPVTTSSHLCLGVELNAPGDPYILPSLNGLSPGPATDILLRWDNNKAQRNMGVSSALSGGSFYAVVHNWSTVIDDIILAVEPGNMFLEVFQEPKIRVIGDGEYTYDGKNITLNDMEPGENRWIELSLPDNEIPGQTLIPVRFNRMVDNEIVDGFSIAVRGDDLKTCLRETISFHASVFFRLYHIMGIDYALGMSEEARKLADPSLDIERNYAPYCSQYANEMQEIMTVVMESQPDDPFDLDLAFSNFNRQIETGNPELIQPVHSIFLNKLDACLTMMDKEEGDTADILLNVYWQRALYQKLEPLQNYDSTLKIIENSSLFIADYSENKVTAKNYPEFMNTLMDSFQDTAYILNSYQIDLSGEINAMEESMNSPKALQKAHRNFLLKLAAVDVPASILGDVNNNGVIDIVDALLTAQYYVGLNPPQFIRENADVNCNGTVDIVDALLIAQYYVGLISEFC